MKKDGERERKVRSQSCTLGEEKKMGDEMGTKGAWERGRDERETAISKKKKNGEGKSEVNRVVRGKKGERKEWRCENS